MDCNNILLNILQQVFASRQIPIGLLNDLDMKDILLCLRRSLPVSSGTVGIKFNEQASNDLLDMREIINAITDFHNLRQWEILAEIQAKELGCFFSLFKKCRDLSLEKVKDKNLIQITETILRYHPEKENVLYLDQLKHYKILCDGINDHSDDFKKFIAAFSAQIELISKVNQNQLNKKNYKEEKKYEILNQKNILNRSHNLSNIPDNVRLDPNSFLDVSFVNKGISHNCIWIRAKDIYPQDFSTALFSANCAGDIKYLSKV